MHRNLFIITISLVLVIIFNPFISAKSATYSHKRFFNKLGGKPALINIFSINPQNSNIIIKPSFGSNFINTLMPVSKIVKKEDALVGINASFFKQDTGIPLGLSVIDGDLVTGPMSSRVAFGIDGNNNFFMGKVKIGGHVLVNDNQTLPIRNVNQPITSNKGFYIYTSRWGSKTPKTSPHYVHVKIVNNHIEAIKQSSVPITKDSYIIVGPRILYKSFDIKNSDNITYNLKLNPDKWNDIKYAFSAGPYLVKNGKRYIDKQKFTHSFLWKKSPRTAIGYKADGTLLLVTIDGRKKGVSEGASLVELSNLMVRLGAVDAMNLDGGSSTQMVVNGKLVSGKDCCAKVSNALIIKIPGS